MPEIQPTTSRCTGTNPLNIIIRPLPHDYKPRRDRDSHTDHFAGACLEASSHLIRMVVERLIDPSIRGAVRLGTHAIFPVDHG